MEHLSPEQLKKLSGLAEELAAAAAAFTLCWQELRQRFLEMEDTFAILEACLREDGKLK